ncbi:Carboxypeptidase regulatory-like domain-containing protein [Chitinophaga jiangningensis]|uniref:Carboxypeptidase regulatory-like domain-containing protein n=2 Tax=Chitinophaga jiangningensis TaxID=1419482 RepID=A0A1M7LIZ4_9BACT|nr:Carboxypeptidase regulatory-like domain-containing protein [Chitinophaga jiangningensis]
MSTAAQQPPPLAIRQVSGVVRDSSGAVDVPQASVLLITLTDTLLVLTNEDGIFVFESVTSAEFTIVVQHLGYRPFMQRYMMNDTKARITLAPILLHAQLQTLAGVTIKGKVGPQLLGDTVQFWADDYIVRDYARLEELIRKLEGVNVDREGNVQFMGQMVKKAMFNGIRYFGGDVKQLLKELPANIVERIQIIDDYGDQANAAGIKSGEATKTINIVSKKDKSVANLYEIAASSNFDTRYNGQGYIKKIDGFNQLEVQAGAARSPAGVLTGAPVGTISKMNAMLAPAGGQPGVSDGYHQNAFGILTYKNKWKDFLTYELYYNLQRKDQLEIKDLLQQEYFSTGGLLTSSNTDISQQQTKHDLKGVFNTKLSDHSQLNTTIGFRHANESLSSSSNARQDGLLHNSSSLLGLQTATAPALDIDLLYIRKFARSKSILTADFHLLNEKEQQRKTDDGTVTSWHDPLPEQDSTYRVQLEERSSPENYLSTLTYTLPFNTRTSLQLRSDLQVRRVMYDQQFYNLLATQQRIDSLSSRFLYRTVEHPLLATVKRAIGQKSNLTAGLRLQQSWINSAVYTARLFPDILYEYANGMRTQWSFRYNGNTVLPRLAEVMPIPDVSNPLNTVTGNPGLRPAVVDQFQARFARFMMRPEIFMSVTALYARTSNKVTPDITFSVNGNTMRRTTGFANVDGETKMMVYYNLTKTISYHSLSLKLDGQLLRNRMIYLTDHVADHTITMMNLNTFTATLTPWQWLDFNFASGLEWNRGNRFAALNSTRARFNIYGTAYLTPEWLVGFDISKKLEHSSDNALNRSPLVVGLNMEKRIFRQKNGVISVVVMDLLRQDNAVARQLLMNGYRDIPSSHNSRYFLLQFSWSPQRWTGGRNAGKVRRNDGSFVN